MSLSQICGIMRHWLFVRFQQLIIIELTLYNMNYMNELYKLYEHVCIPVLPYMSSIV